MEIRVNKEFSLQDGDLLWRYIDLHQLLYFCNTKSIFFSPLLSFSDPMEGIYGRYLENSSEQIDYRELEKIQKDIYASCWFLGNGESMAMWQTHSNPDSVALCFDGKQLVNLIVEAATNLNDTLYRYFCHGPVEYAVLFGKKKANLIGKKSYTTGFLKDESYKHEQEFRFVIATGENNSRQLRGIDLPAGDLKNLDFRIVTHPEMERWKHQSLVQVLDNFGLAKKLVASAVVVRLSNGNTNLD